MKKSTIKIEIELNQDKHPNKITWHSDDNPSGNGPAEAKAMLLSLFDKDYKDTFKIDLWTPEMQVVEMDRFMFQTLKSLADTYFTATRNSELASAIRSLSDYFGQETGIIPKQEK